MIITGNRRNTIENNHFQSSNNKSSPKQKEHTEFYSVTSLIQCSLKNFISNCKKTKQKQKHFKDQKQNQISIDSERGNCQDLNNVNKNSWQ